MNSSSVRPPQRIRCEASVECLFFFTTYFTVRALLGAAPQRDGAATCTTSETISATRMIHSSPL